MLRLFKTRTVICNMYCSPLQKSLFLTSFVHLLTMFSIVLREYRDGEYGSGKRHYSQNKGIDFVKIFQSTEFPHIIVFVMAAQQQYIGLIMCVGERPCQEQSSKDNLLDVGLLMH